MNNIEQKALELVNEVRAEDGYTVPITYDWFNTDSFEHQAFLRAIERHEAFRQEVSDAIVFALKVYGGHSGPLDPLRRFIITKPDPLVEIIATALREGSPFDEDGSHDYTAEAKVITAALARRGLEIREINK